MLKDERDFFTRGIIVKLMTSGEPIVKTFQCNICGAPVDFPLESLGRETPSCPVCRSTPRVRSVVDILARHFFGHSLTLPDFPTRPEVRGLGLTDSNNYASRLVAKFDYENTFLHTEPQFDITAPLTSDRIAAYDFVIASEIFEHVLPPVARAFDNTFQLLKPGGLFVLTVPYGILPETIEHFPELHEFTIDELHGKYVLTNYTRQGVVQRFDNLIFHGGPGSTLEMRVFAEVDLNRLLLAAGFTDIMFHMEPLLPYGITWPGTWSRPISARRAGALTGE
ncbi:MAG: methyltransferase domain-containing protein [Chthoniobacterales bacterium]